MTKLIAPNEPFLGKANTLKLLKDIRNIYLYMNKNYTTNIVFNALESPNINLLDLFGSKYGVIKKYLSDSEELKRYQIQAMEYPKNIEFSPDFDFKKDNNSINHKLYGHKKVVETIKKLKEETKELISIVSLGIGDGFLTNTYADVLDKKDHIIGVDLHDKFIQQAKQKITRLECHKPFDFNKFDHGGELDIPDASIDVVECSITAHHVANFSSFTDEVARILKPNGTFIYLDLIDRTEVDCEVVFDKNHTYPLFHGYEIFRSSSSIASILSEQFQIETNMRINPGLLFSVAKKL